MGDHPVTVGYDPTRWAGRELAKDRKLWMKQPGESIQAYSAFMTHLTTDPAERTLHNTARLEGKSFSLMSKWSMQWRWKDRVGAYEEHYLMIRLESVAAERDMMYQRQRNLAEVGMSVVEAALMNLVNQIDPKTGALKDGLKPEALARLLDTSTKIQRMAVLGRAENAREVQEQNEKLAEKWSDELVDTLQEFLDKMQLPPDQQEAARQVLGEVLIGGLNDK